MTNDAAPTGQRSAAPAAASDVGALRDGAVAAAEQAAVALASLDPRNTKEGYDRLLELLTEPARQEWEQRRGEYLASITTSDTVTSAAMVRTSGVTDLDPAAGTATVLVAAIATVSSPADTVAREPSTAPEKRHFRLQLSLIRTPAGWKVSQLQILQ